MPFSKVYFTCPACAPALPVYLKITGPSLLYHFSLRLCFPLSIPRSHWVGLPWKLTMRWNQVPETVVRRLFPFRFETQFSTQYPVTSQKRFCHNFTLVACFFPRHEKSQKIIWKPNTRNKKNFCTVERCANFLERIYVQKAALTMEIAKRSKAILSVPSNQSTSNYGSSAF